MNSSPVQIIKTSSETEPPEESILNVVTEKEEEKEQEQEGENKKNASSEKNVSFSLPGQNNEKITESNSSSNAETRKITL